MCREVDRRAPEQLWPAPVREQAPLECRPPSLPNRVQARQTFSDREHLRSPTRPEPTPRLHRREVCLLTGTRLGLNREEKALSCGNRQPVSAVRPRSIRVGNLASRGAGGLEYHQEGHLLQMQSPECPCEYDSLAASLVSLGLFEANSGRLLHIQRFVITK